MKKSIYGNPWLRTQADVNPDAPAIVSQHNRFTYRKLYEQAQQQAALLSEKGIGEGTHVAIVSENSEQYIVFIHALLLLRAVIVPVNTRLNEQDISQQIAFADCSFVIENNKIKSSGNKRTSLNIDTLLLMFTSGSTGEPKCVELTYKNILYNAIGTRLRLQINQTDTWLLSLPLYHIGGISIVFRSVIYGIPVLVPSDSGAEGIIQGIADYNPSIVSLVPTVLYRILRLGINPNPAHKTILLGGGPISDDLLGRCYTRGWKIVATYGMTETSSQIATRNPADTQHTGSAGQPLPFNRVRIVDDSGNEVPRATEGEITVQSPSLMKSYYKRDDLTARVIQDAWFFTGDYGYLSDDNYLYVVSRRSDLIVSGGENVNPVEVENALRQYPGIYAACVFPYADDEWGEVVAAAIVSDSDNITDKEIKRFLADKLASFKIPKKIFSVKNIPFTEHSKSNRRLIGEQIISQNR